MFNADKDDIGRTDEDSASSWGTSSRNVSRHQELSLRRLRILASVLGLLGTVLALAVPFLPVNHDITTLKWPTAQGTKPVSAPLVSYSPIWIDAQASCESARSLDARANGAAILLSTNPLNSEYGKVTGLALQVDNGQLSVLSRGQQLGSTALPKGPCTIPVHADASGTEASIDGQPLAAAQGDQRPQLTGIFSELDASKDPIKGVSLEARVDNRFESYATSLKVAAIMGAVAAFLGSLVCLRRFDVRSGRRPPRWAQPGWWKPTGHDVAVFGVLVLWWLIGAMTADDGYFLTMARARDEVGYASNYYRWFGVPETPFAWQIEFYAKWVKVSTATPWVRLPALLMGLGSWILISRQLLPRLGQQVRRSNAAGWAAAAVFLAFWMPYNNGLRPEPIVVLLALCALCAVERTIATNRLLPATLGLVCAALSVGANPHGMVAVLPFVAALKPLLHLLRKRADEFGWLPVLAPVSSAGFVLLTVVFADQTWQSTMDGTDVRTELGPYQRWYEELARYSMLFSPSQDGSLTRRFPVMLVILCLVTCLAVLLRRSRIRGAALGPSRRLLAVAALSFVVLTITPTKHTHHFGVFAAVGGALAALTALATSSTVLRSRRNRSAFFAGLMAICAFVATGPNAWWYVSGWGVPWFDKPPSIDGRNASTMLLGVAAIAGGVACIEHLRRNRANVNPGTLVETHGRALRLGTAPLSIICALIMVGEVATFAKAIAEQSGSYSLGADNIRQLNGSSCGLSDYVYVETNPKAGILTVSAQQPTKAIPDTEVPRHNAEKKENADAYLQSTMEGFRERGLPPGDGSSPNEPDWKPLHQFGDAQAPVWGSYDEAGTSTGELRSAWYNLPERATNGEVPVVLSLAGTEIGANSLSLEFGRDTPQGFEVLERRPVVQGPAPQWRDHRTMADGKAEGATKLRVVAHDQALGANGWLAVNAPRAPQLTNMTEVVGDSPAFVEWTAALVHPCLEISGVRNGVAEMPKFRVQGGGEVHDIGPGWSSPDAGGPFGWMSVSSSMRQLPTYMHDDINRDWGSLYAVDPYAPDALPAEAAMEVHTETHWGTWTPGVWSPTVQLPGDVPSSDDRTDLPNLGDDPSANSMH